MSSSHRHPSSWISFATLAVIGVSSAWFLKKCVNNYGWNGTLRYIWEGDPNPAHIRNHIEKLESAEKSLSKHAESISVLEEGLERARLDSIDGSDPSVILISWRRSIPEKLYDLRTHLALLSHDLDTVAGNIDQVPTENDFVRQRKKQLSRRVVQQMEQVDTLISFFQSAIATESL